MAQRSIPIIDDARRERAEIQIQSLQKIVDFDSKEYPVEIIVQKFLIGEGSNESELFIPDYQRSFTWNKPRQSKFVESILLGLPIPYIFTADREGRLEIVDGSQRIRSLVAFSTDQLTLQNLKKLTELNGFKFSDLPLSRQRRFNRQTIRIIELTEKADEEARRDIFERINTGSDALKAMETRKGVYSGGFYEFITECSLHPVFRRLCPINSKLRAREEGQELILRFFAYSDNYLLFKHSVREFLDNYIEGKRETFDREELSRRFFNMLSFVDKYFPNGFAKTRNATTTPRVRFEAISVGTHLALSISPNLVPQSVSNWIESEEFKAHVRSDASNSRPKVEGRIHYVRDKLLGV